ncbi:hypothetical protein BCV71DRAFT_237430 [Rhizopus microsporus]|uniref:Uncharacterized protein n=1 Tax=Rhizopus microsporus TaxID=58291 RepID=A0A1X0RU73_RHIZD|nr:hypothetical protein BCV71DRAFT_237430 [Rhizopus microsporus]
MNIFNFKFVNELQWSIYVRRKSSALYSATIAVAVKVIAYTAECMGGDILDTFPHYSAAFYNRSNLVFIRKVFDMEDVNQAIEFLHIVINSFFRQIFQELHIEFIQSHRSISQRSDSLSTRQPRQTQPPWKIIDYNTLGGITFQLAFILLMAAAYKNMALLYKLHFLVPKRLLAYCAIATVMLSLSNKHVLECVLLFLLQFRQIFPHVSASSGS